jgi:hypothetical protein
MQINLHKCQNANIELNSRLSTASNYIALITEPLISKRGKMVDVCNGKAFDAGKKIYRACIIADPKLNAWAVPQFTSEDMTTICLKIKNRNVYVTSVYMDIDMTDPPPKFDSLLEHCRGAHSPLVVGTDSNSHSIFWGCDDTNTRGLMVEGYIFRYDLTVHNRGVTNTFLGGRGSTIIDLTLTNNLLEDDIFNWKVDESASMSDHRYVLFEMDSYHQKELDQVNLKKADWSMFRGILDKHVNDSP